MDELRPHDLLKFLESQLGGEVKKQKEKDTEVAVIKTKVERLEQDMKDVRGEQKDQSKKLDELLQRVRPSR